MQLTGMVSIRLAVKAPIETCGENALVADGLLRLATTQLRRAGYIRYRPACNPKFRSRSLLGGRITCLVFLSEIQCFRWNFLALYVVVHELKSMERGLPY